MSKRAERNFLGCFLAEILTIIIVTLHFIITPTHLSYAFASYTAVLLVGVALAIAWVIFNNKQKSK